jgi:prepilin signal peptidase PulO-like enzyme (type II secretory pathway)
MSYGTATLGSAFFAVAKHSPRFPVVILVLGVVFGVAAYLFSERFKRRKGVTPWRWPSFVWGIVGLISLLLWLILFLIAINTTKVPAAPTAGNFPGPPQSPGYWSKDPTGRYESRYWDGTRWTEHVSDGTGATMTDPP